MEPSTTWVGIVGALAIAVAVLSVHRLRQARAMATFLQQQSMLVAQALDTAHLSASHLDLRTGTLTRSSPQGTVSRPVPAGPGGYEYLFESLPDAERERVIAYLRHVLARGDTDYHFEFTYVAADGSQGRMAVTGRVQRGQHGEPLAFAGVEEDVTRRRRLEEQIQNAQRLESLGMLAGGIAHDFNNLVMGILGGVAQLDARVTHDPEARRALGLIDRGATRAAELTQQLLAYAGRGRAELGPVDLEALVTDLAPLLDTSLERRATVALEIAPDLPPVQGEATQLRQVVMNLVLNAAEAMPPGGVVIVRLGLRQCAPALLATAWHGSEIPAGTYLTLEVADTGCGMTAETRQRIFDPFFTTKFTGRGLGLAAVLGIVQRHDGAILVESALGRGTSFTALLPPTATARMVTTAPAPEAVAAPAPIIEITAAGRRRVLIVDDEDIARDVAAQMLESAGFVTEVAADGEAALRRLQEAPGRFAVVLLDLTMPGRSGLEIHREIRGQAADLPVVLMSGYGARDAREALLEGTPTAFLQKPFRTGALLAALESVLPTRHG